MKPYSREKRIAKQVGLQPVAFSGSRFDAGREDASNDVFLVQIKSSKTRLSLSIADMWLLFQRATREGKIPTVLFDGMASDHYPEQLWVCLPLANLEQLLGRKFFDEKGEDER